MIFALLVLIFIIGFFLTVKKVRNGNGKQNLPPGPWGLPFLGHLVFLGRNPHLTLMKWKQKYGPIIHIRFGSFPTVVLGDSKMTKEAFNMPEFAGRPQIQVYMENNLAKGMGLAEGPYNTELRLFAIRKLKEFGMGRKTLEGQIHEGASEFLDFIKMRQGLPIKSEEIPSSHIVKTLWSILMTEELNPEDVEKLTCRIKKIAQLGPVLSELAGFMPWLEKTVRILSFGRFSFLSTRSTQLQEFYSFFEKPLEEKNRQTKAGDEGPADIMDFYLEKIKETTNKSSPFHASNDSAKYVLGDLFGGAIHTIHTTLTWTLNFMAKNPEVQIKVQAEIDEVIGNSRLPSLEDREQMPYADAVVNEVLRITPPIALGVPHKTTKDVSFHGYTIKKDTMIFANLYGIHHDPEIWGDPEIFRPERWLGEQGKQLKRDHFLPFSTGRRNCPGESLAREQLFLYITTLCQQYNVKFDLGKVPEVKAVIGIFLAPSKFTVVFNQRKINKL